MEQKNNIVTLFEFTQKGYEEQMSNLDAASSKIMDLRKEEKELNKTRKESAATIQNLITKWEHYEKTLNSSSTKEMRLDFVATKNALKELTVVQAKATTQSAVNTKAQDAENKKLKEAEALTKNYAKVLSELKKGMDNAEVSTESLTKAKKYLRDEMNKKDINTGQYTALSKELALVEKTINTLNGAIRQNVKDLDVSAQGMEEAKRSADAYSRIMTELSKDAGEANVSLNELIQTQRYIREQMSGTPIGAAGYDKLREDITAVNKALAEARKDFSATTAEADIHENSIAALRIRYNALHAEWDKMNTAAPNYAEKTKQVAALRDELAAADAQIGVFSRNVGNYKSGFDGLGNSIAQLTREAPAFAHSVSTGFMAISNNIPTLTDEIKKLKLANAALNAEGVKTPPIWKTVLKSFLSWNTLISTGIVLLTVYGKDIVEWVGNLFKAKDAMMSTAEAQELINKKMADGASTHASQIVTLKTLQKQWNDLGNDLKAKTKFIEDNKQAFDKLGVSVENVGEAENVLVENTPAFIEALDLRAKATAAHNLAVENYEKIGKKKQELEEEKTNGPSWKDYATRGIGILIGDYKGPSAESFQNARINGMVQEIEILEKGIDTFINMGAEATKAANKTLKDARIRSSEEQKAAEKARKTAEDAAKKAIELQKKINEEYKKSISERQKAEQDYASAIAEGDEKEVTLRKKTLDEKISAEKTASTKRLTLTQGELDEIELQEYLSAKAIENIRKSTDEKKTDTYLQAAEDLRSADADLLEAQKRGNAEEITLLEEKLALKQAAYDKAKGEQVTLTEEQALEESIADQAAQQKKVDDYITLQTNLLTLRQQFKGAETDAERDAIDKQIGLLNKQVEIQVAALKKLGVEASSIAVTVDAATNKTEKSLSDTLQQSLSTIETFTGKSKNSFFKLSSSIAGLVAKAFDMEELEQGADESMKDYAERLKEFKEDQVKAFSEMGVAVLVNGLNTATELINESLEREKQAIEDMYDFQEKRAQKSYKSQSKELDSKLKNNSISEAKHRLEQLKLADKKAEKEEQIEKDKANALYEIEVKQFRVNQAQDATSAIIATALAIMQAYATMTDVVNASVFAGIIGTLGAVQVASIYAQKPPQKPKFEKGGYLDFMNIEGDSHKNGGVPISIGGRKVAEAEGGEGALIVSKKAMKNSRMRNLLAYVEELNRGITGGPAETNYFENGGFISYDEIYDDVRKNLKITKRRKKSVRINGDKVKLKNYGGSVDKAADEYADNIATEKYNKQREEWKGMYDEQIKENEEGQNAAFASDSYFQGMDVKNTEDYYNKVSENEAKKEDIDNEIASFEELADARTEDLKSKLDYDNKMAKFEEQKQDSEQELADTTLSINKRVLKELYESGQIEKEEYLSMLDQVEQGYGAKTSDIIALKKKEVEETKKLINEERNAEIDAAKETAKYREDALSEIRKEWSDNYNDLTKQIIDDVENASDAVSQLTGTDLERFNQILSISQEMKKMEEDYKNNETLLTDGVVQSREERAALVEEQKRIQAELKVKEIEAEEAKKAFEEERQKNMESARKEYETANFESLLEQIKALGGDLQTEGDKWNLDKQLTADLDENLKQINTTYDEQIAKQDAIVNGLQAEIDKAELLHQKRLANIKSEEDALKNSFETQKAEIDAWLKDATDTLRKESRDLATFLATLKAEGIRVGMTEYERKNTELADKIEEMPEKFETGGAINLGSGLFEVSGASHAEGGVPVKVGNTTIAEVEAIEKMFAVNKFAARDPEMIAALQKASGINAKYTGVPLVDEYKGDAFSLDYDLLAAKIGAQINTRPVRSIITHKDIDKAVSINERHRRSSMMN